jgi:hypothetical protein
VGSASKGGGEVSDRPSGKEIALCGIPFWMAISEGSVTFNHIHGFYGVGERITVQKYEPTGLLHVQATSNTHDGFVPACHIKRATEIASKVLGPDHFRSLDPEREHKDRQDAKQQIAGNQQ